MTGGSELLRVGHAIVPFEQALSWTRPYLDAAQNRRTAKPFAFPAYDEYEVKHNDPERLSDADLLAPVLLNVGISIRSYYALQAIREPLNTVLHDIGDLTLIEASDKQVSDLVSRSYSVLDHPATRPPGIKGTKLSKILHRKRPDFLVLHDTWVQNCYLGTNTVPVVERGRRTWTEYMVLISLAIRDDLVTQQDAWRELLAASSPTSEPTTTLVRLLDIVAWRAGQAANISTATQESRDGDAYGVPSTP